MTVEMKRAYRPSQEIIAMFVEVTKKMEMDAVFLSGVTGDIEESSYLGIAGKVLDGDMKYH